MTHEIAAAFIVGGFIIANRAGRTWDNVIVGISLIALALFFSVTH